jgi:outer membrane protein assembly factor BamB
MATCSRFRHALAAAITAAVLVTLLVLTGGAEDPGASKGPDEGRHGPGRDWPMFGGSPSRHLVNLADRGIPTNWVVRPGLQKNVKWSVDLGSKALGGPVISGGKVFIGTNNNRRRDPAVQGDKGILMCFRESDGAFLWQAVHDKLESGRVNDWPEEGIASVPAVAGNRLYYVTNRCELVCADTEGMADGNQGLDDEKYKGPRDADVIWRLDMMKELDVFPHNLAVCSPLLVGDTLFVVTGNGVDEGHLNIPSPEAPSFLAVDKKSGKVLWSDNSPTRALANLCKDPTKKVDVKKLVDSGRLLLHGQWSNPVYVEPAGKPMVIFPGGDGWVYSFRPKTGELIWKFDCNPKKSVYVLGGEGTRNDFVSTPVVWENKLYIGVGQDPEHKKGVGHLWCIDIAREPKNAEKDLSPVKDNFDPKAEVNKDSGLVWHYGGDAPEDAERPWVFGRTLSTCSVHDGLCYAAEYDGFLHCLDARTGKQYWEHEMKADTWSSPCWVDGKVYQGSENGQVFIFQHHKTKKLLGKVPMGNRVTKLRATPVVANGVLYVTTENPCKLWAIAAGE